MSGIFEFIGSIILASIPVLIWGNIFYKKNPEDKWQITLTFLVGALSVFPILLYKWSWQFFPWLNAFEIATPFNENIIGIGNLIQVPLSVIISFALVGLIEEVMKLSAVRLADTNRMNSVDDAMEFFIISALGFSFTENILYFYNIWINHGSESIMIPFILRSSFSTFAHLLFSGILGYYYGTAHFSTPELKEALSQTHSKAISTLHKAIHWNKDTEFHQERIFEGLFVAVCLHAVFNLFLEMNLTFMIVPFLSLGYLTLNYLFSKYSEQAVPAEVSIPIASLEKQ